ncbi:hypothetical protein HDU99_001604 [Rhizoclosmatium hyalinum]|nr:hypothetical protein HDU99_001604 [Rhizoclosmatium hyalinum]
MGNAPSAEDAFDDPQQSAPRGRRRSSVAPPPPPIQSEATSTSASNSASTSAARPISIARASANSSSPSPASARYPVPLREQPRFAAPAAASSAPSTNSGWLNSLKNTTAAVTKLSISSTDPAPPRASTESGRASPTKLTDAQLVAINKELSEKPYLNSARIVHNYGATGIAPLVPLSQSRDDKSVIPVMVSWTGGGRVVHITGTFNNWRQKIRLTKSKTDFSTVIDMPAGDTHRFKFIVDDEWKCSEDLPIASDSEGNLVNYLEVMDEFGDQIHDGFDNLAHDDTIHTPLGESPESSYASEIPTYLSWHLEHQNQPTPPNANPPPLPREPPPDLPPHLEKVFLNAPVPVTSHRDDNLILPVPSGVTLNHLYACSIRDGVMALSTTTRYKQKYVTTILYKPVVDTAPS